MMQSPTRTFDAYTRGRDAEVPQDPAGIMWLEVILMLLPDAVEMWVKSDLDHGLRTSEASIFSSVGAAACFVVGVVGTSFTLEGVVAGEEAGEEAMVRVGVKGAGVARVGVGVGALEGAREGAGLGIFDDAGLGGTVPVVSDGLGGAVADKSGEGLGDELVVPGDGLEGVAAVGIGVLFGG
jgi:hypothetical protein